VRRGARDSNRRTEGGGFGWGFFGGGLWGGGGCARVECAGGVRIASALLGTQAAAREVAKSCCRTWASGPTASAGYPPCWYADEFMISRCIALRSAGCHKLQRQQSSTPGAWAVAEFAKIVHRADEPRRRNDAANAVHEDRAVKRDCPRWPASGRVRDGRWLRRRASGSPASQPGENARRQIGEGDLSGPRKMDARHRENPHKASPECHSCSPCA